MNTKRESPVVTMLLIEDDDDDFFLIKRAVKQSPYDIQIIRARNGREALIKLAECKSNGVLETCFAILTDINMPFMDGLEFLAEIECDAELSEVPVFVNSTSDRPRYISSARQSRISDCFSKVLGNTQLLSIVDSSQEFLIRRQKQGTGTG